MKLETAGVTEGAISDFICRVNTPLICGALGHVEPLLLDRDGHLSASEKYCLAVHTSFVRAADLYVFSLVGHAQWIYPQAWPLLYDRRWRIVLISELSRLQFATISMSRTVFCFQRRVDRFS